MQRPAANNVRILFRWLCQKDGNRLNVHRVQPTTYWAGWQAVDVEEHTQVLRTKSIVVRMPVYSKVLGKKDIKEEYKGKDESEAEAVSLEFIRYFLGRGLPLTIHRGQ